MNTLEEIARTKLPLPGEITPTLVVFNGFSDNKEHFSLIFDGEINDSPLVRVHSECVTGDVFGSLKCDCGKQLSESIDLLGSNGGILIYLRQEGRGIGLTNKIRAYSLQEGSFDTFEANEELGLPRDARDYTAAAQMLNKLGIHRITLLTSNPSKEIALRKLGIEVSSLRNTGVFENPENKKYLDAKKKDFLQNETKHREFNYD